MRKFYVFITLWLLSFYSLSAQNVATTVNEVERKYLVFVPQNEYSEPRAMLLLLHGNGSTAEEFATLCNGQEIADITNFIVVFPEALDEQNQELLSLFTSITNYGYEFPGASITGVWNAGMSILNSDVIPENLLSLLSLVASTIASAGKIEFNKDVDDVAFLNQVINEVKSNYNIDEDKIYMEGASMGGAMTYKYAFSEDSQVSAIAVVAGFIGAEVNQSKTLDIPVCVFHSINDEVVPFDGGIFSEPIQDIFINVTGNQHFQEVTPVDFPDIAADGITVKATYLDCGSWFYEITGASHAQFLSSDYETGPNDIDYLRESMRFFLNTQDTHNENIINKENSLLCFPNPAKEFINANVSGLWSVYTLTGECVLHKFVRQEENIFLSGFSSGLYLIAVETEQGTFTGKLIKK